MKTEKLNLDALKQKAEAIASEELLSTINGGTENGCHVILTVKDPTGDLIIYK